MSSLLALVRQIHAVLQSQADQDALLDLLSSVDKFVRDCTADSSNVPPYIEIEEQLHNVHRECFDHSSQFQTDAFLAVLNHLCPIYPAISIVSSWFDLIIRPALRDPKLSLHAVNNAKELILQALKCSDDGSSSRNKKANPSELRRQLFDLYLLNAFNEGSGGDILEWAELDQDEKDAKSFWKSSLEDILLKYGADRPQDLLTEIESHFCQPSSRLQLLNFLNLFILSISFQDFTPIFARHELASSLLMSLLVDNSSTVCSVGLTVLVKLLPMLAKYACDDLKAMLPRLLAILARMFCWVERPPPPLHTGPADEPDEKAEQELESQLGLRSKLRPDIEWTRLEMTFDTTSSPPSPRRYFTMLYYLFPCNVIRFLRKPFKHLSDTQLQSPFDARWEEVFKERELRSKSEALLRAHACHPYLVRRDALQEMALSDVWTEYDVPRMVSESILLDLQNITPADEAQTHDPLAGVNPDVDPLYSPTDDRVLASITSASMGSLQDMLSASVALKATEAALPKSPHSIPGSPQSVQLASPSSDKSVQKPSTESPIQKSLLEALSALQRESILRRNELKFELWLSRQTAQHISRLYVDRIQSKHDEAEWQALYNKLRNYRAQVTQLGQDLQDQKVLLSSERGSMGEWKTELQSKLRELRAEKKVWISEAAALRTSHQEVQAMLSAQGKLLAESTSEVFKLRTQQRETQHKIDRLRDYERQIEQHIKMQRLWDDDFRKFNSRGEEVKALEARCKQLELRLKSYEESQGSSSVDTRTPRERSNEENNLRPAYSRTPSQAGFLEKQLKLLEKEKILSEEARRKLREEKMELQDEVDEMRAMIELLKGQVEGRRGIVGESSVER